jgi:hypothetical protein
MISLVMIVGHEFGEHLSKVPLPGSEGYLVGETIRSEVLRASRQK